MERFSSSRGLGSPEYRAVSFWFTLLGGKAYKSAFMKALLCLPLIVCLLGSVAAHGQQITAPQPGTPLRQTILDDLRTSEPTVSTEKEKKQKVVFEKVTLRVSGEWAWVSVSPSTADNKWHSEPLTGLMHHTAGRWKVVEYVGDEVSSAGNPAAAFQKWRAELLKKNPECPPKLVPQKG